MAQGYASGLKAALTRWPSKQNFAAAQAQRLRRRSTCNTTHFTPTRRPHMRLKPVVLLSAAALALSFGTAQAAGKSAQGNPAFSDAPGFNDLDKDRDGSLSRSEAAGNPTLAKRFNEVD